MKRLQRVITLVIVMLALSGRSDVFAQAREIEISVPAVHENELRDAALWAGESVPLGDGTDEMQLPRAYSSVSMGYVEKPGRQGDNDCWARAVSSVALTSLIKEYPQDYKVNETSLSVAQMALNCYGESVDPLGLTEGDSTYRYGKDAKASAADTGNPLLAAFELMNWRAPVFSDQEKEESYATAGHARDLRFIDVTSDKSIIKKLIMEYGSATMLTRYAEKGLYGCNEKGAKYTPPEENPEDLPSNHAMTVVGWDDDYPKENFTYTPADDGAYLVKNSYGTETGAMSGTGGYDSRGYCWISYEDCYFTSEGRVFTFIGMDINDRFDHNYGYDGSHNPSASLAGVQKAANVFILGKDGGCEELRAISFGCKGVGGCFDIEIFSLPMEDGGCVWEGEPVSAVRSFPAPYPGVYTVDLSQPVTVMDRGRFAVVITPVHEGKNFTVITDQSAPNNGGYVFNSAAREGDGYVQIDGSIMDVTKALADEDPLHASNVLRIRAYTKDVDRGGGDDKPEPDDKAKSDDEADPLVPSVPSQLKVPVSTPDDNYACADDNFAPVCALGSIKKLELDFDKVSSSGVNPGALTMTVIAGSKLTTSGRLREVTGVTSTGGIRVKADKRTMRAKVKCRYDGSATFIMEDGNIYTVTFRVQKPGAVKGAKKLTTGKEKVIKTIKDLFATDIDAGTLFASSKKDPAAAQVSGNAVIIDTSKKNDIRVRYEYLDKKYKLLIKVR
ncbi:MAG: hypothetical protein IJM23_04110 [Lachnospiraceae bacterium]|nr:hypothetical protein [Lachnospiraceae bacterium]